MNEVYFSYANYELLLLSVLEWNILQLRQPIFAMYHTETKHDLLSYMEFLETLYLLGL